MEQSEVVGLSAWLRPKNWTVVLVTGFLLLLSAFAVRDFVYGWELNSLSVRQRFFALPPQDRSAITPITLVTFDSKTEASDDFFRLFGTPPSRAAWGYITRFFRRADARGLTFDVSFNGGIHHRDVMGDQALADSTRGTNRIASALIFSDENDPELEYVHQPAATQVMLKRQSVNVKGIERFPAYRRLYAYNTMISPYPQLLTSGMQFFAANSSIFKSNLGAATADIVGDSRRWTPFAVYGDHVFPTLALGMLLQTDRMLTLTQEGQLRWPHGAVNLGADGLPLIKWYGHGVDLAHPVYPEVSLVDIIFSEMAIECRENPAQPICVQVKLPPQPLYQPSVFKNRYVLVGMTLPNAGDTHKTIFSPKYFGLYIFANVLDNLLHNDFVYPAPLWLNTLLLLLLPGAMIALGLRLRSVPLAILLALALSLGHFLLCMYAYNHWNLWLYAIYPILGTLLCFCGLFIYRFLKEQKQRQQLRYAFGKYVSPSVMEIIERHPERVTLGGERRVMTFLFSDIRGFTTFSDNNTPEVVQHFLTQYFSTMNKIILREYHGSINKLIGDAIMAYWGFPLENEDHAFLAVSAALAMREALRHWQSDPGKPPIDIGVGINTGDAVIGNVGSEDFMDFTVIGDAVNVASRLESANKEYKTNIIISAATYEQVKDRIAARSLGFVTLRGKGAAIEIFEPIGWLPGVMEGLSATVSEPS
jgi:class 3 adenylate cyclase